MSVFRLFCLALLSACGPARDAGVPKGCVDEVRFSRPILDGFGLSSHIEWGEGAEDAAHRAHEQAAWTELGVRVVRRDLSWSELEPEAGEWNLAPVGRVLDATDAAGAELLALLDYGNPAYPPHADSVMQPVQDPADFARYAATIARVYGDRLHYYEIWNEPNAGLSFWHPREDPEAFAALLRAAVPAIRAEDPDAVVAMGGLFWPSLLFNTPGDVFLEQVADALPELGRLVDAVPIHPYRYPFTVPEAVEDHQGSMVDEICAARAQLDDLGLDGAELWVGELGWHTAPDALFPGLSAEDQASVLVRAALLSFAQGATQFGWYTFRDSGLDPGDQEQMFGLVGYDPDPLDGEDAPRKPAYHAFATLSQMLGAHHTIRDLSSQLGLDAQTYGYALTGGAQRTVVLWTDGPAREVWVPLDGSAVLQMSVDGSSTRILIAGGLHVQIGPGPIFLMEIDTGV